MKHWIRLLCLPLLAMVAGIASAQNVAKVGSTEFETLQAAFNAATDGETVTLLKDYNAANETMAGGTRQFVIKKSITFDGNGHTLTTKQKGIGIGNVNGDLSSNINVTIKDITIVNSTSGARCIDTRGMIGSLTLNGVTLNTNGASGFSQPLTIGGNQSSAATVNITNSTIQTNEAATAYYAVITFNPVNMTITNSTLKGWACIYAKGQDGSAGSAGSTFKIEGSDIFSNNKYSGNSNTFGAFVFEDNNVTVDVTNSNLTITNTGDQTQAIAGCDVGITGCKVNLGEGNNVRFVEPGNYELQYNGVEVVITGGTYNFQLPDEILPEGYKCVDNGNGTWTIKEIDYVAQIGDVQYETLAAAVTAANAGDVIKVIKAGDYTLPNLSKNVTVEGAVNGVVFTHTTAGSVASIPNGASFKNVKFVFGNVDYHGFQHAGTINMENCTLDGKFFSYGDMNFTNCEFTQSASDYHMWCYSGNVTYTGCTFTANKTGKFLNIYNEGLSTKYTVTVENCKFVNNVAANKAALNVKATSGAKLLQFDVIINNCTTEGNFPAASSSQALVVLNDVVQVDDRTADGVDNIKVWQDGVLIYPVNYVAQIGETKYETLAAAVDAANAGDVIEVIKAGDYTLPNLSKNVTVEGAVDGVVFTHTTAGSVASVPNGATFKNVKFVFGNVNYHGFQHAGTINMEGCTLDGLFFSYGDMNFTNCEFTQSASDYHMWCYSGDVTYTGCTFTANKTGKFLNIYNEDGTTKYTVTVENCKFVNNVAANKAALNVKATCGAKLLQYDVIINNCTTEGSFPEASTSQALVVLNNVVQVDDRTADGVDNIKVWQDDVLIYPVNYVAQIGDVKYMTLQAALDAAEAANTENFVIDLLADAELDITAWDGTKNPLSIGTENTQSITINGNNHKLTFNQKNSDWNNVATMNDAQTKLVLNDMTISSAGHNNGPWNRHDINFNCAVELNNVTSDKALAFKNDATLKNVTITDNSGDIYAVWISPRGQKVDIDGLTINCGRGIKIDDEYSKTPYDATLNIANATFNTTKKSAILVKNGGETTINAGEGINIEHAAADTVNPVWVDEDKAEEFYKVTVTGANVVPESKESDYVACLMKGEQRWGYYKGTDALSTTIGLVKEGWSIKLHQTTTEAVEVSKPLVITKNGFTADNVTAGEGFVREENDNEIIIREASYVAQIGDVKYETLQAALDAAEAADTENFVIELLADAELDITAWDGTKNPLSIGTENTQSITINGNNHKLTFNQKNSDWNNVATMNDAKTKLVLNNMTISNAGHNDGPWNRHDINFNCAVELNNVTSDKALAFKNDATLKNVTISDDSGDIYAVWIKPQGQTIDIEGLIINCKRGIKIDDKYVDTPSNATLNIANATFNTTNKSAILVKNNGETTINVGEGINIEQAAADTVNPVWVDEDKAEEFYKVTVTGANVVPESKESDYVACLMKGEQRWGYYKGTNALSKSIAKVEEGWSIKLHNTTTETVEVSKPLVITKNGCTADNVTAGEGFVREETNDEIIIKEAAYVAQIGDVKYTTLAKAVEAVPADGTETTIVMIDNSDIEGNSGVTIPTTKNVKLDLNGKTVTLKVAESKGSQLITNNGTLTITDSSEEKNGKLTNAAAEGLAVGSWPTNNYVTNIVTNSGNLTIEAGNIVSTANGSICYAVDNNSTSRDAILNVKGGYMTSVGTVVRQFCNSATNKNVVNISDGVIETNGSAALWVQLPGSDATKAMKAELNVSGGTLSGKTYAFYDYSSGNAFTATQYNLSGGTFDGGIFSYGANITISDGTYNSWVAIKQTAPSDVKVTGGKFADEVYTYGDNASEKFISGGIYATKTYEEDGNTYDCDWMSLLAEGYEVVENTDEATKAAYPWAVKEKAEEVLVELIHGVPYPYPEGKECTKVTYKRTFDSEVVDHYRSWYVPFDYTVSEEDLEKFKFYKIHMIAGSKQAGEVSDVSNINIFITKVEAGTKLVHNKPYVIVSKEALTDHVFTAENVDKVYAEENGSRLHVETAEFNYDFYGTYREYGATKPRDWYALGKDGTIAGNKSTAAKLQSYVWAMKVTPRNDEGDYSNISFSFVEGDDTDQILNYTISEENEIEGIYTVNGIKVDEPVKGVNIIRFMDGKTKKIYVK